MYDYDYNLDGYPLPKLPRFGLQPQVRPQKKRASRMKRKRRKMGESSRCSGCLRVTIGFLNLAMMVVALAVIGLAIWIRCDNNFEKDIRRNILQREDFNDDMRRLKADIRTGITVSFWVIIGISIACVFIGLAGLLGAAARSRALIGMYFAVMIILILLEIAIGIYVLVERKHVRTTVKDYVRVSYTMQDQVQDYAVFTQRYHCCGIDEQPCGSGIATCSSAVWDRLDYTIMVFGCTMLCIIVAQIFTAMLSLVLVATPSRYADA